MMKSTPVRFSSARMLRPSRPMIRPFMSSEESCTTETVVSAAWPAASRCMQTERMLRTRRSASRLVSSSIWRRRRAASWRAWSSTSLSSSCFACGGGHAGRAARARGRALRGRRSAPARLRARARPRVRRPLLAPCDLGAVRPRCLLWSAVAAFRARRCLAALVDGRWCSRATERPAAGDGRYGRASRSRPRAMRTVERPRRRRSRPRSALRRR